ncbi:MAG: hypothetical protein H6658_03205 [Ardenticatenaceae bacterium]|nr:hypothetical protein [Ardenticatenaceae bacterium]
MFRKVEAAEPVAPDDSAVVVRGYLQAAPSNLPVGETAVSPTPPLEAPAPALSLPTQPLQPVVQQPPTPPPPQPAPTPTEPVVQAAPEKSDEDWGGQWQRMKRIMRGHEAKQTQAGDSPPTASDAAIQRAISAAESGSGQPSPAPQPPLQESTGWPIIRKKPEALGKPKTVSAPPPPAPTPQQEAQIRAKLSGINAGQPTDSSIEVHLPRRPRPAAPSPASPAPVQRQESPAVPPPAPSSQMVPTEIGPLPADMWELLGEPVPTISEPGGSEVVARSEEEDEGNEPTASLHMDAGVGPGEAVQRAIAAAEAPSSPPRAAADVRPTLPSTSENPVTETAVPVTTSQSQEVPAAGDGPSGDEVRPAAPEAIQRAIAYAESPTVEQATAPNTRSGGETAVPHQRPPAAPPSAHETSAAAQPVIQRTVAHPTEAAAPAAAKIPPPQETAPPPAQAVVQSEASAEPVTTSGSVQRSTVSGDVPAENAAAAVRAEISPTETPAAPSPIQRHVEPLASAVGPSPATVEMPPTAVPDEASRPSPASGEAVQRAIAAAEKPSGATAVSPTMPVDVPPAVASVPPTAVPDEATHPSPASGKAVQRAIAAAEKPSGATAVSPTMPADESPAAANVPPTAVPDETSHPSPASGEAIQRAIAAAEKPSGAAAVSPTMPVDEPPAVANVPPTAADVPPTAVLDETPHPSPASGEAVQRAIAAAEKPSGATAVSPAMPVDEPPRAVPDEARSPSPASAEEGGQRTVAAGQRAIAAVEAPSTLQAKPIMRETAAAVPTESRSEESAAEAVPTPATPEAVQRAIAAAEAPAQWPGEPPQIQPDAEKTTPVTQMMSPTKQSADGTPSTAPERTQVQPPGSTTRPHKGPGDMVQAKGVAERPSAFPREPQPPESTRPTAAQPAEPVTDVSTPASPEAVQRAIAAAEAAPTGRPVAGQAAWPVVKGSARTTVPTAAVLPGVQRTAAKVEPPQAEVVNQPTVGPLAHSGMQPVAASPEAIQRAAAAAEGTMEKRPYLSPTVPSSSPVGAVTDQARLQRAIAAAEAPAPTRPRLEGVAGNVWRIAERPSAESSQTTTTADIMRAMAESPGSQDATTFTTPILQRALTGETTSSVEESLVESSASDSSEDDSDIDIDILARKVYAQLKRRLALEWERGRGKR